MADLIGIDTSTLSNLFKSGAYSTQSIGLDALFAPGRQMVILPEIYWEAVGSHLFSPNDKALTEARLARIKDGNCRVH